MNSPLNVTLTVSVYLPLGTESPEKMKADWWSSQAGSLAPFPSAVTSPLETKLMNKLTLCPVLLFLWGKGKDMIRLPALKSSIWLNPYWLREVCVIIHFFMCHVLLSISCLCVSSYLFWLTYPSLSVHSDRCISVCKLWPLISGLKRGTQEDIHSFGYWAVRL